MTVRTLYIRNVPDELAERLEELARDAGLSVNALVVRELAETVGRSRNAALLDTLPVLDIDLDGVVRGLSEDRGGR